MPPIPVRVDFRSLMCLEGTGEWTSSDEPFMLVTSGMVGQAPAVTHYPQGRLDHWSDVDEGEYVFDKDNRVVMWQGPIDDGERVQVVVVVAEKDRGVGVGAMAGQLGIDLVVVGAAWFTDNPVLLWNSIAASLGHLPGAVFGAGGNDHIGTFRITVENQNGALKARLTPVKRARIKGNENFSAISKSGWTIRMRLDDAEHGDVDYLAALQVRDLRAGGDGDPLRWARTANSRDAEAS